MLSAPPATIASAHPFRISWYASPIACVADAHADWTVRHGPLIGYGAARSAETIPISRCASSSGMSSQIARYWSL
jgi:hypothetical protein